MNFNDALLTVKLTLESGAVPLLIGESGIGKTSLIKQLGTHENYYVVNIDANLLKEGEIGGLPTVEDYIISKDENTIKSKRTIYAIHIKLLQVEEYLRENNNGKVLLFIDELNRCEHTVQQELMNLILNREINGYMLPKNVDVIAAMNPSNKYNKYHQSEYQVVDMDPAQENRFVWIDIDSDTKSWLTWAMSEEGNIHTDIIEFIGTFPDYLHTPYIEESIKATPRSWERVSKAYGVYLSNKNKYPSKIFYNLVKGNVGGSIAQDFLNFLEENKNPIIKPQDIFEKGYLSDELYVKVKNESHSRLYIAAKNALLYLKHSEHGENDINLFAEFIQMYPKDLKVGIMQEVKFNYSDSLYKEFLDNDIFIEGYFSLYEDLDD